MRMPEYIGRAAFRKQLIDRQITTAFFNNEQRHEIGCIVKMLDNAPAADVVEVVRCRECKHSYDGVANLMCGRNGQNRNGMRLGGVPVKEEHFCSYGERKDNETYL